MFKLRLYSEVGSSNYNKGTIKSIIAHGTKKQLVKDCKKQILKSEVVRSKDNVIVYKNH